MQERITKKRKYIPQDRSYKTASDDSFAVSLCSLTPDEIAPGKEGQDSSTAGRLRPARIIPLIVFALIFVFSASMLIYTAYDHAKAQDIYNNLDEFMFEEENLTVPHGLAEASSSPLPNLDSLRSFRGNQNLVSSSENAALSQYIAVMRAKISSLKASNPDVVGYITIKNTKISYPIMHTTNNDFYLNHDYLGGHRLSGSIFLDYRNYADIPINENSCIYGHNLTNGNMMNNITYFLDEDFFNENKYIEIITEKGLYTYEVFAVYKTDMYSDYITTYFKTTEDVIEFAKVQESRSLYKREGIEFKSGLKLLTLSTCTNVLQEERYTVQAMLVSHDE